MTDEATEETGEGVSVFQVILGYRPFVLVEITDVDAEGFPEIEVHAGGGFPPNRIPEFLRNIADDMDAESAAQTSSQS